MPGYATHKAIAVPAACITGWSAYTLQASVLRALSDLGWLENPSNTDIAVNSAVIAAGALFGGTLGSPDLDIPSSPYYAWGALRFIWLPWQIAVKHRSPLSHWPIVGTIFKWLYFMSMLALLSMLLIIAYSLTLYALGFSSAIKVTLLDSCAFVLRYAFIALRSPYTWLFFIGDCIGQTVHTLTDYLDSMRKQRYRGTPIPTLGDERPETPTAGIWER